MREDLTEVVIVLDRSGSMDKIRQDMKGGLNRFLEEQKKEPGECQVTLVQFDNEYEVVHAGVALKDVPPVELVPRGMTALRDALGRTINSVGERLEEMPEEQRPGKVVFLIITDGLENASREFSAEQVREMIERQQRDYSWLFVYLGANQDAFAVGQDLGVQQSRGYTATGAGVAEMTRGVSRGIAGYRGGRGYTDKLN